MTIPSQPELEAHVTPPGSFSACPLTPPASDEKLVSPVLRIIEDIKKAKTGTGTGLQVAVPWAAYLLDAEGYQDLLHRLEHDESLAGFAEHELRLDYFPSTGRLVLRMPSIVHEHFIAQIVEEIQNQLKAITGTSAEFAKDISTGASSRVKSADPEYGTHDPDAQFQHSRAQYPGVVIEVSYSQKRRDLPHLADDYILGSDSNIQVVIGLDIEYEGDKAKMATFSRWEDDIELEDGENVLVAKQTIDNQVFRNSNGEATSSPGSDLQIRLRDFAPDDIFDGMDIPQEVISISAVQLCTFLEAAESKAAMVRQKTGVIKSTATKTWAKKRRREVTPAEELHPRDEKRYKTEEDKVWSRANKEDSSFSSSLDPDS
ncbi:hypothetical protein VTL71DRAFT_9431 [Oculimacula yallundae]|uniref:Uncharacterized protein n=1 Tax=Oculimacula yallundae TaxID=86028 RepID=A0ABR4BRW8_9HELO